MKVEGQTFPEMVSNHIKKYEDDREYYRPIISLAESYGLLAEEFDEFFDEVKKKDTEFDKVVEELVDIAALCQKITEDLNILEPAATEHEMEKRIDKLGLALYDLCCLIQKESIPSSPKQLGGNVSRVWEVDNTKLEELKRMVTG